MMMLRSGLLVGLLFLFSACSPSYVSKGPDPLKKIFPQEDHLIINALMYSKAKNYNKAIAIYEELFSKSSKNEYLFESLKYMYELKLYEPLLAKVNLCLKDEPDDKALLRFKVATLNALGKVSLAKGTALHLLSVSKAPQDYQRVASLYLIQNDYKTALKYLESAYTIDKNENILIDLVTIMYLKLQKKKEAVAYLESHSHQYGCSVKVCEKLATFYSDLDDREGQITTYKRLYEITNARKYARLMVQIYAYNRDTKNLVDFLEKSGFNDEFLLRLYMAEKIYFKSTPLAQKLFLQTKKPFFQAQYAISLYEGAKKLTAKVIGEVIDNLESVLKHTPDATYLNYLGYLLINHDVNVKEGIKYVNQALAMDQHSGFYLDSLAWGYYKLGQCKKAKKIIVAAKKILGENKELQEHYQMILKCK